TRFSRDWSSDVCSSDLQNADAYSVRYTIPNIMNTYIRTTLNYDIDLLDNYTKSVDIDRPFFSPFARWAGGVYVGSDSRRDSLPDMAGNLNMQSFKFSEDRKSTRLNSSHVK